MTATTSPMCPRGPHGVLQGHDLDRWTMTDRDGDFTIRRRLSLDGSAAVPAARVPPPSGNRIELRLDADLANLPIVRSVAGTVAAMLDHDLDAIADLTLAVDEVCSTLIGLAAPGATLTALFVRDDGDVYFEANARTCGGALPDTSSFGWRVLTTLADQATCWTRAGQDGLPTVHISVVRGRQAGTA